MSCSTWGFKGFQSTSLKKPTLWDVYCELSVFQIRIQTVHGISTNLHNIQMFRINYSGIIGIPAHALSDFSTNLCKNCFLVKSIFFDISKIDLKNFRRHTRKICNRRFDASSSPLSNDENRRSLSCIYKKLFKKYPLRVV